MENSGEILLRENVTAVQGLTPQQVKDILTFAREEALKNGVLETASLSFFGQPDEYRGIPEAAVVKLNKGKEPPKSFSAVYAATANFLHLQPSVPPIYRTGFEETQISRGVVHSDQPHIYVEDPSTNRMVTYVHYKGAKESTDRDYAVEGVTLEQRYRPDYYQDVDNGGIGGVSGSVRMYFVAKDGLVVPAKYEVFRLIDFQDTRDIEYPFKRFNTEYRKDLRTGVAIYKEDLIDKRGAPGDRDWAQQTAHIKWIQQPDGRLVIAIGDEALMGTNNDQTAVEQASDRVTLRYQNSKWDTEIVPILGQHSFYRWWLSQKASPQVKDSLARDYFNRATTMLQEHWASPQPGATLYDFQPPAEEPSLQGPSGVKLIEDKHAQ